MSRYDSIPQDFPEDGEFNTFPISPESSILDGLDLVGVRESGTLSRESTGDIPVLLFDNAYARDSFASESSTVVSAFSKICVIILPSTYSSSTY